MCSFIEQTGSVQQDEEDEQTNHDNDLKMILDISSFLILSGFSTHENLFH